MKMLSLTCCNISHNSNIVNNSNINSLNTRISHSGVIIIA